MRNYSLLISKKIYVRNILVFIFFGFVFLLYHSIIEYGNLAVFILLNALVLFIFIFTAFKPKLGLYIFIFFIPLLNSVTTIMAIRSIDFPIYMFFGFFLGFLLSFFDKDFKNRLNLSSQDYYDKEIYPLAFVFLGILVISLAVTLFRYANFFPFITNNYYNLKVNLNGVGSSGVLFWVIKYFFNYAIAFFFLFALFNIIDKKKDIIIAVFVLISATVISSIYAIYQYYFNPTFGSFSYWAESGRINSTFSDPNALGAYCVIIFPIFLSMVIFSKRWYYRLVFSVFFILFIIMTFFSGSRTALLGIVITLFVFLLYGIINYLKYLSATDKKKRIINLCIILPLIFLILISMIAVFLTENQIKESFYQSELFKRTSGSINTFFYHFNEYGFTEGLKSISNFRHFYWGMAVNMAKDYPLTGVGTGSYIIELPDYLRRFGAGDYQSQGIYQVDYAGNYYLQVLAELGAAGLMSMLFMFFLIIKKTALYYVCKRKIGIVKRDDRFLFGLFVSFIVTIFSLIFGPHTNFTSIQLIFWLVIGLILSYVKIMQSNIPLDTDISVFNKKNITINKPIKLTGVLAFTRQQKVLIPVLLFLFFSSFMLSSLTGLSIHAKQNRCQFENTYGFFDYKSFEGRDVRWISIDASTKIKKDGNMLTIPIQDAYPYELVENVNLPKPLIAKFYIDNMLVKRVKLENNSWYNVALNIPGFTEDWFTLTIVLNRSWVPKDLKLNFDTRELGARIGEYEFE
ncbi:MAG: hypothetical protein FJW68_08045 [Actinobacteria bacterium]|nr:hypothetical protein [Actinomycetota bacterium]